MTFTLANLELREIDRLSRPALLDIIQTSRDHLPADLVAAAEKMPTDRLRLLVLSARIICALRLLQTPPAPERAPDLLDRLDV